MAYPIKLAVEATTELTAPRMALAPEAPTVAAKAFGLINPGTAF